MAQIGYNAEVVKYIYRSIKMIYFTTKEGKVSKINLFALITVLTGLVDIYKPFIPVEYLPLIISTIGAVNFVFRTFFPSSGEVVK